MCAYTRSVDETRALAAALAGVVQAGDLILLAGDLGAGKTAFVQGLGRGLGVTEPITSPTFTLEQRYDSDPPLHHLDVYRLEQLSEVLDLGLSELLDDGGVVVVEWGDAVVPVVPNDYLKVRLTIGETVDDRVITFRSVGSSWTERAFALADATAPWRDTPDAPDGAVDAADARNGRDGGSGEGGEGGEGGSAPC
ncbi:MAG TPA: tRNA (adenosine(37)-N6)-threonylcarbamoyltransferase complex ATPase subunit type 1 TsaE [Acidimicrobiales bacterium]